MNKSDFEINNAVAEKLGVKVYERSAGILFTATKHRGEYTFTRFDPCNNPADAMPIVIENGISLIFHEGIFQFATYDGNFEVHGDNPYRAAMEIFLMMKDAEK